jgi:hypothetical protein
MSHRQAERPPVTNLVISLRLRPRERAEIEELANFYGHSVADTIRLAVTALHTATFAKRGGSVEPQRQEEP